MSVTRAVRVDVEVYSTGQLDRTTWYKKKCDVTVENGVIEFRNELRIDYADLQELMRILEQP